MKPQRDGFAMEATTGVKIATKDCEKSERYYWAGNIESQKARKLLEGINPAGVTLDRVPASNFDCKLIESWLK